MCYYNPPVSYYNVRVTDGASTLRPRSSEPGARCNRRWSYYIVTKAATDGASILRPRAAEPSAITIRMDPITLAPNVPLI